MNYQLTTRHQQQQLRRKEHQNRTHQHNSPSSDEDAVQPVHVSPHLLHLRVDDAVNDS